SQGRLFVEAFWMRRTNKAGGSFRIRELLEITVYLIRRGINHTAMRRIEAYGFENIQCAAGVYKKISTRISYGRGHRNLSSQMKDCVWLIFSHRGSDNFFIPNI